MIEEKEKKPIVRMTREERARAEAKERLDAWIPKTSLGKKVKLKEITDVKQIIEKGMKIRESEIIDRLLPNLTTDFILLGQAHGKFGGGKRRLIKQTQKKTAEGNKPIFTALAVVGNGDGYYGIGIGTARESIPAREKATRNAKLNIKQVVRGCGSWKCTCGKPHSLPFEVKGRSGSVRVVLKPAPKGTGLAIENEMKKLMKAAGYKDIWSKTNGQTRKKMNFVKACVQALDKAVEMKAKPGVKITHGAK